MGYSMPRQFSAGGGVGRVIPCSRPTPRQPDQPYEEFRRAGIGLCFQGEFSYTGNSFYVSTFIFPKNFMFCQQFGVSYSVIATGSEVK